MLAAVTVLLIVGCVVLALLERSKREDVDAPVAAREAAVQSGRQAILNLDALSAPTIDKDLARVIAGATGKFKDQFSQAQVQLKELVVSRKTESSGTILSAGIVRSDSDTATVLVAVDRLVKDSTNPKGATAHDRWRVDLELHGGRWLVANLDAVA